MKIDKFLDKLYNDSSNQSAIDIAYPLPIPTTSHALNWMLNGGIRPGGFYCFIGPEQSGKSFMALSCIAELLKADKESIAFWFDCEHSFSTHFKNIFLPNPEDAKRLVVRRSDPPTGSEIFDYFINDVLGLVQDGLKIAGCVVDSLQTIVAPKESNAKSSEDHIMGDLSAYLPKAFRLISSPCKPKLAEGFQGIPWIFISQVRDNLDPSAIYTGKKYRRTGGKALGHNIDVEILFEPINAKAAKLYDESTKNMNESSTQIGHRVRAKIEKNRFGPPRIAEFDINYNKGIVNQEIEIATLAKVLGLITKEGNTYSFNGEKVGVGEAAMIQAIKDKKLLQESLIKAITEKSDGDEKVISDRGYPLQSNES